MGDGTKNFLSIHGPEDAMLVGLQQDRIPGRKNAIDADGAGARLVCLADLGQAYVQHDFLLI